ncbi:MAG: hypothetical protein H6661_02385 [Ardenticatenaceae bacterium]|nr:hypothetical protein [Ardenticatenaceae bacterium]
MVEKRRLTGMRWLPLAADALALAALWLILPTAVSVLQTPSGWHVLYLIGAYIVICVGVYLLRKLEPGPNVGAWAESSPLLARPTRIVFGVLFGLAMMTVMAYQFGFFQAIFVVDTLALGEGESATLFAFAPGAWLGMSLLYTAFLALRVTPTVSWENGRYRWQAFLGLLCVNVMFVFLAAQLKAVLALWGGTAVIGPFFLVAFLFLLLFGPPRLIYLSRQRDLGGVSFLVLILAAAWLVSWQPG